MPGQPVVERQVLVDRTRVQSLVHRFSVQLQERADAALLLESAKQLHDLLIAPIEDILTTAQARTLVISANGFLRYVAFAALHDGRHYLVERFGIARFNESGGNDLVERPASLWHVAGMGATKEVDDLPALPGAAKEVADVTVRDDDVFLDARFNRSRWDGILASTYNVMHVASHFVFERRHPEASRLYFGDRSRLTLAEITRANMNFSHLELITLSACETARGAEDGNGSEIESLAAQVQQQGARAVLATLWKVSDRSTGSLMKRFYAAQRVDHLSKSEALRAAQQAFISKADGTPWSHPYYWASFTLSGDWR